MIPTLRLPALAAALPRAVVGPARVAAHVAGTVADALTAVGAPVRGREVWLRPGRAHIQLRAAARAGGARAELLERVGALQGVRWCTLDAGSGRLVVDLDTEHDGEHCTLDDVLDVLDEVEESQASWPTNGDGDGEPAGSEHPPPEHPADSRPLGTAAIGLTVSAAGLAVAAAGRVAHLRALPTSVTSVVAMADTQPRLRGLLEDRIGRAGTDTAVAVANAVVQVLAQGTVSLAVDVAQRTAEVVELRARRDAWEVREPELYGPPPETVHEPADAEPADAQPDDAQPDDAEPADAGTNGSGRRPMPPGRVEQYAQRVAEGGVVAAAGTLLATRSLDRAGQALLVAAPRAGRAGRDAFACALTIGLGPRGVIPFTRDAFRRLDRIDTVVLDPRVLRGTRRLVLDAEAGDDSWTREEVWGCVQRLLWHEGGLPIPPPPGRSTARLSLAFRTAWVLADPATEDVDLLEDDHLVGRALVGWELDPLAAPVVSAARSAGLRLVVPEDPNLGALADAVDEMPPPGGPLHETVRALQERGRVVAVVSAGAGTALRTADLGIAVVGASPGDPVPAADVLAGPSLDDVRRVLLAGAAARRASSAGVTLAAGASVLGGLLLVAAPPGAPGSRVVLPVHLAAALALGAGTVLGTAAAHLPAAAPMPQVPWHALEADEVLTRLRELEGPAGEAWTGGPAGAVPCEGRTAKVLAPARRLAVRLGAELADPLTPVLAVGAAASALLGSGTDAGLVGGVMAGNALISAVQGIRAESALGRLLLQEEVPARRVDVADPLDPDEEAAVLRVRASALRPGDVIELRAGEVVPADARLLSVHGLEVDEASLTGEAGPVPKHVHATPGADLADRACMVHEGTAVLAGSARAVVVAVGSGTEAGRAVALAGSRPPASGLHVRLADLTGRVLPVTLLGGGAVTALSMLRGQPARAALASGVAVAVAAVPEGLPLVTTVAQLAAARRLSRRGVLVRSSGTVEALGRVDTVCFDKTGTLTQGRLRLVRVADLEGEWDPSAIQARRLLRAAALSSPRGGGPVLHATDRAVLEAARRHLPGSLDQGWDDLGEVPFDSSRGYSAALGRRARGAHLVVKGAPEVLLPRCSRTALGHLDDEAGLPRTAVLDGERRRQARQVVERLAADGLRVLAVAFRPRVDESMLPAELPEAIEDLTLLGFVALADTPRPEAADAVRRLRASGIEVLMITGDHPTTARAIAEQVGLGPAAVLTGRDLEGLDEDSRVRTVTGARVFARTSPEQKVRIVEALHRAGRVVAMTGDGTNDAAAIRLADVGIGMGAAGSTAARRAADIVLTEPHLALVLEALGEGRAMWSRVQDAVAVLVGGNLGEVAFTVLGTALGGRAPIGTRQLLLVNLLTDMFPAMAIALAAEDDPGLHGPRPEDGQDDLVRAVAVRGAITAAAATAAWGIGRLTGRRRRASTMGLAALVGAQLGQTLLVARHDPGVVVTALGSGVALVVVVSVPGLNSFFGCTPLGPLGWSTVAVCSAAATAAGVLAPRVAPVLAPRVVATYKQLLREPEQVRVP